MPSNLRSNNQPVSTSGLDGVIAFLKSDVFAGIVQDIVSSETERLRSEISDLKTEVRNLRESNIEMVKLLSGFNSTDRTAISYAGVVDAGKPAAKRNNVNVGVPSAAARNVNSGVGKKTSQTESTYPVPSAGNSAVATDKDGDWKVQARKRRGKQIIHGCSPDACTIKGAVRYEHFHVFRLDPSVDANDLEQFLISRNLNGVKCYPLNSRRPEEYSSFKVSVPSNLVEDFKKPDTWPENVCVNRFFEYIPKKAGPT